MTEYLCKAVFEEHSFQFETMGAVTILQAYEQFSEYLFEQTEDSRVLAVARHVEFERIEM
ncbi:hypothetical protein [Alteromonas sp. BMJM2]|uniref:hypothetical protein n=1 Tax=Alteromonas sp. BMJM2 TaxID=2954241 RepID=UPI0022B5BE4C|nr:hypothetical protein [Alteromonas sp. BMJM2]